MKQIDARNKPCPQPVLLAKKELDVMITGSLQVLVDNKAACDNVARMAGNAGCCVDIEPRGNEYVIHIDKTCTFEAEEVARKTKELPELPLAKERENTGETVFFISSDSIGQGSDELGRILMKAFYPTQLQTEPRPGKLVFMNSGVKLAVSGSDVLESLKKLEDQGAELLVCGTCLDYFGAKDTLVAGRVSNMFEIAETFTNAGSVITV